MLPFPKLDAHGQQRFTPDQSPRERGGVVGQRRNPLPYALSRRAQRLEDLEQLVDFGATSEEHVEIAEKRESEGIETKRRKKQAATATKVTNACVIS